jgi:hypothetical protein
VVVKLLPDEHFDLRNAASLQATKTKQKGTVVSKKIKSTVQRSLASSGHEEEERERETLCRGEGPSPEL